MNGWGGGRDGGREGASIKSKDEVEEKKMILKYTSVTHLLR